MVGDRTLAEDLTQDVFLRIYHGLCRVLAPLPLHDVAVPGGEEPRARRAARPRPPATPDALDDVAALEVVDAPPERIEIDRRGLARGRQR